MICINVSIFYVFSNNWPFRMNATFEVWPVNSSFWTRTLTARVDVVETTTSTSHRATTVRTLTRRAQIICDSTNSLRDENEHLRQIFHKNDYSDEFIDTNKYKHDKQNDVCANTETKNELTTVSLPCIRGTSETIARILKSFNIRKAHKPTRTLRHLLTNVKDKDDPKDRQGTVYRIRCNDCNGTYIRETGRTLTTRLREHQTATDKEDLTNNIAQHHRKIGHDINWDSATCLTHSTKRT